MSKSRTPLLDPSALPMLRLFAVLVLLLESAMVGAVDLGVLHWKTVAGKPGFAEIELKDRVPIDAATLRVSIASRDAYALAGLTYHPSLAKARLSVQAAGNRPVLRIDNLPQDQQWLDLIVVSATAFRCRWPNTGSVFKRDPRKSPPRQRERCK